MNSSSSMPVCFLGHGNPMNAIEENEFVKGFRRLSSEINKPTAIRCISAHWETMGTRVTAMERPRAMHDFGGLPTALYEVQYPAPGSPSLAKGIMDMIQETRTEQDYQWGLDHGAPLLARTCSSCQWFPQWFSGIFER